MWAIGGVIVLVGMLFYAVQWIEGGAVARVEASNIAKAAEVQRQSFATSERLRIDAEAESAERDRESRATIATIRQAEANARAEAEMSTSSASDAWALVDELEARTCPPPPKPDDPCSWICTIPEPPE